MSTPHVNARIEGDEVVQVGRVNIGLSVVLDVGLIVPVINDADRRSLREIARNTRAGRGCPQRDADS